MFFNAKYISVFRIHVMDKGLNPVKAHFYTPDLNSV